MEHRERRGLHQPVEPDVGEAHMIGAAQVVDARVADPGQEAASGRRALLQQAEWREHADPRRPGRLVRLVRPAGPWWLRHGGLL
jgi:hypothetical protein